MAPPVETYDRLHAIHPDAHCELDHANAFQLLCATVLSAQTTDVNVNKATPTLFAPAVPVTTGPAKLRVGVATGSTPS